MNANKKVLTEDEVFELTGKIVDSAVAVHKEMGPGLLESVYEHCLMKEFELRNINACRQVELPLIYKGYDLDKNFAIDILVDDTIILEIKSVEAMNSLFEAQLLSYLKLSKNKIGYLLNFNVPMMKNGIKRMKNGY